MAFDWSNKKVYVAGHNGLVGSGLVRALTRAGAGEVIGWRSAELDLRDRDATFQALHEAAPDVVIDAAARVGGIMANSTYPVDFLQDNMLIQTNVMDAAHAAGVDRLLFLGSSCIYPRHATQPIRESSLMTGPLEPTNQAYAMAKISGGSKPPDSGVTLQAAASTCGTMYMPEPWLIGAAWTMASLGPVGSTSEW